MQGAETLSYMVEGNQEGLCGMGLWSRKGTGMKLSINPGSRDGLRTGKDQKDVIEHLGQMPICQ
jgi:hypothetical protein